MNLHGTAAEIMAAVLGSAPEAEQAVKQARGIVRQGKPQGTLLDYQAAALFALAAGFDGKQILEIGTYYGFSAAVMAMAAPRAAIVTLNPTPWEWEIAQRNLSRFPNVQAVCRTSWDYLDVYAGPELSLIFVDGDHKQVKRDLPWWNKLATGGLMVFHDFSPNGSARACPPVYRALIELQARLGREFDVLVVDDGQVGMAGFYKQPGDPAYLNEEM